MAVMSHETEPGRRVAVGRDGAGECAISGKSGPNANCWGGGGRAWGLPRGLWVMAVRARKLDRRILLDLIQQASPDAFPLRQ